MTIRLQSRLRGDRAIKACVFVLSLALVLGATARPARAEPLALRLHAGSTATQKAEFLDLSGGSSRGTDVLRSSEKRSPLSLVLLGASVAAAGAATYFGTQALSASSDWRAAQTTEAQAAARDRTQSSALKANIGWAAAGAFLLSGAGILFFTDL